MYMYEEVRDQHCLLKNHFSILFLRYFLLWNTELIIFARLTDKKTFRDPLISSFPAPGLYTNHHPQLYTRGLGIQTQILMFVGSTNSSFLNYLP